MENVGKVKLSSAWGAWRLALLVLLACSALSTSAAVRRADAASSSAAAIALPRGEDPSYLYIDLADAGRISERLSKSELIKRFLVDEPDAPEFLASLVRNFPGTELTLMLSAFPEYDIEFQVACKLGPETRGLLDKVARGTASAEEAKLLFEGMFDSGSFDIHEPDGEAGEVKWPCYTVEGSEIWSELPYFSSAGGLLVLGNSPEVVKRSIEAVSRRGARFVPRREFSERNALLIHIGSDVSGFLADGAEDIFFEGALSLVPGGWNFDVSTNAMRIILGGLRGFEGVVDERISARPVSSFLSAGGGRLLVAVDGVLDLNQLLAGALGIVTGSPASSEMIEMAFETIYEIVGPELGNDLAEAAASMERFNFALVADEDESSEGLRSYIALHSGDVGAVRAASAKLADVIASYSRERGESPVKISQIQADGWDSVYAIEAERGDGEMTFTLGVKPDCILGGIMRPSLLSKPFTTDSVLYESLLGEEGLTEMIYIDARRFRRALRASIQKGGESGWLSENFAMPLIFFLTDFRELGIRSYSPSRYNFTFRTGGLDFDDWAFIRSFKW
ncbi:MAG: hypothetical protein LBS93_01375 [Synergistaceae bacterium]|jgi:hypothetical protein|nr:hypothetical protein [Synergistaceae bacterium]